MMTPEAKKKYDAKVKRTYDAISLKEPDRVPINIGGGTFAVTQAGYTVAECIYDTSMAKAWDAVKKYLLKYDPDSAGWPVGYAGEGPVMELLDPTFMMWAGMPGNKVPENSMQQFNEFPVLLDDEFDRFYSDRTGWIINTSMPRISNTLKPMANMTFPLSHRGLRQISATFSTPDVREMIQKLWKADEMYRDLAVKNRAFAKEVEEMGYPSLGGGKVCVPFDEYSDCLRGTLLSLTDLYDHTDEVQKYIDEYFPQVMDEIKHLNPDGKKNGRTVMMTLHKGMDGFMSAEHYEKYYWRYLREIIYAIVDVGMIPNVFCEGRYSSRLDFLRDVPKGKVIFAFEQTPMDLVKKKIGDVATITGGFSNSIIDFGSKQKVIDETKKMLDACAPGGGFLFRTNAGLENPKPENVDALYETLWKYGKY